MTKSIAVAQEVYYLANGQYAEKFEELDIDMPGDKTNESTDDVYYYDWGFCYLQTGSNKQACCKNTDIDMEYQQRFSHTPVAPNIRVCATFTDNINDVRNQICQAETNRSTNTGGGISSGYFTYSYQD